MERPNSGAWGQPPPTTPPPAVRPPQMPYPPQAPRQPYGPPSPPWDQQPTSQGPSGSGRGRNKVSLRSSVGRDRGARGLLLGLGLLAAGVAVAIVLCLLPPHWTGLRVIGFLIGMVGAVCFVAYANNGRTGPTVGLGLMLSAAFLGAALYSFEDTTLAATGVEGECAVVGSEKNRTDAGGYQYNYSVECPGGIDSTLRGQPNPPPDSRTVTLLYQPDGLIEPQAPQDVSPTLSLVGATLSGSACVGWALAGLRGRRTFPESHGPGPHSHGPNGPGPGPGPGPGDPRDPYGPGPGQGPGNPYGGTVR